MRHDEQRLPRVADPEPPDQEQQQEADEAYRRLNDPSDERIPLERLLQELNL